MASQLASIASYKQPSPRKFMQEASYRERGSNLSLSKRSPPSSNHDYQRLDQTRDSSESEEERISSVAKGERSTERGHDVLLRGLSRGQKKRFLSRIGLWFVAYSVLKKAKALHERLRCDPNDVNNNKSRRIGAAEAKNSVDAYFSIPVVYASDTAPYV